MINVFRNYALLVVVFIHAHIDLVDYSHAHVPAFLVLIYNKFFGYFHPASILAAISGYLFYKDFSEDRSKWQEFLKHKYLKRIKSIALPYIFWVSLFFVINNLIIYVASNFRAGMFVSTFNSISFSNYISSFFHPELAIARHLWYLNNMVFMFALAPLMPFFNRNKILFFALVAGIVWFYDYEFSLNMNQAHIIIKYRFVMFFLAGAMFAMNKNYLKLFVDNKIILSIACLAAYVLGQLFFVTEKDTAHLYLLNSILVPVLVFYFVYALIAVLIPVRDTIYNRSNHFLLYIIHTFLLSVICKLMFFNNYLKIDNYFILLLTIIAVSYIVIKINSFIYHLMSRYFKGFTHHFL